MSARLIGICGAIILVLAGSAALAHQIVLQVHPTTFHGSTESAAYFMSAPKAVANDHGTANAMLERSSLLADVAKCLEEDFSRVSIPAESISIEAFGGYGVGHVRIDVPRLNTRTFSVKEWDYVDSDSTVLQAAAARCLDQIVESIRDIVTTHLDDLVLRLEEMESTRRRIADLVDEIRATLEVEVEIPVRMEPFRYDPESPGRLREVEKALTVIRDRYADFTGKKVHVISLAAFWGVAGVQVKVLHCGIDRMQRIDSWIDTLPTIEEYERWDRRRQQLIDRLAIQWGVELEILEHQTPDAKEITADWLAGIETVLVESGLLDAAVTDIWLNGLTTELLTSSSRQKNHYLRISGSDSAAEVQRYLEGTRKHWGTPEEHVVLAREIVQLEARIRVELGTQLILRKHGFGEEVEALRAVHAALDSIPAGARQAAPKATLDSRGLTLSNEFAGVTVADWQDPEVLERNLGDLGKKTAKERRKNVRVLALKKEISEDLGADIRIDGLQPSRAVRVLDRVRAMVSELRRQPDSIAARRLFAGKLFDSIAIGTPYEAQVERGQPIIVGHRAELRIPENCTRDSFVQGLEQLGPRQPSPQEGTLRNRMIRMLEKRERRARSQ